MGKAASSGLIGSVAEKVIRKATCPVMTVPPPAASTSNLPFNSSCVQWIPRLVDSRAAVRVLAGAGGERCLTLLHVFEWPSDEASAKRVLETSEFHRQWERETRYQLEALIPDDVRNW